MRLQSVQIKNGGELIFVQRDNLKSIAASVAIDLSSISSGKENGIPHFVEHLICQDNEINKELDRLGVAISGETFKQGARFDLHMLKQDFFPAFRIFMKRLLNYEAIDKEIKKEKKIILEEIALDKDDYYEYTSFLLDSLIYQNSILGQNTLGTEKAVKNFSKKDINLFYNNYYIPKNIVICVAGDINPEIKREIIGFIDLLYSKKIKNDNYLNEKNIKIKKIKNNNIIIKYSAEKQSYVSIGFKALDYSEKDKYVLRLIALILASGYNSRLFKNVREKKGLVYLIDAFNVEYKNTGNFEIKYICLKNNVDKILKIIFGELKKIKTDRVSPEEIKRAKKIYQKETLINLENPLTICHYCVEEKILTGKNINFNEEIFKKIEEIDSGKILEVSKKIFKKENIYLAAITGRKNFRHKIIPFR